MKDLLMSYELQSAPPGQQSAFFESVRSALVMNVREALFSGSEKGLLDVEAVFEDGKIRISIVDLSEKGDRDRSFHNDKTADEFYNTVTEDDFMSRVMTSARRLTPQLYDMLTQSEKAFK